jgi:gamma-glutamyl hercynylcysteine S-oxide synthase
LTGDQIRVAYRPGMRFFDVYHGAELQPKIEADAATLAFEMEPHGYGAMLAVLQPNDKLATFLTSMKQISAQRLTDYAAD